MSANLKVLPAPSKPRLILGLLLATIVITAYAIAFWYVVFVLVGWETLRIGMGLGGAIYPVIFMPPLLVSLLVYYAGCYVWFSIKTPTRRRSFIITLGVPILATSILLVAYCPMDGPASFASELFAHLFH